MSIITTNFEETIKNRKRVFASENRLTLSCCKKLFRVFYLTNTFGLNSKLLSIAEAVNGQRLK